MRMLVAAVSCCVATHFRLVLILRADRPDCAGRPDLFLISKEIAMLIGKKVPDVTFRTRVRDESVGGPNPFRWQDMTSADYFKGKRVILFSLPGAFTPTCSTYQLPDFEKMYPEFQAEGIDEIYCISVNDAFVMNAWGKSQNLNNVKLIPDGSGEFTRKMGMLVHKDNLGFGMRSWRYAAIINDGQIEQWFEEEGYSDNCDSDPYGVSSPQNIMEKLKAKIAA
jgi:peroxiredoxin